MTQDLLPLNRFNFESRLSLWGNLREKNLIFQSYLGFNIRGHCYCWFRIFFQQITVTRQKSGQEKLKFDILSYNHLIVSYSNCWIPIPGGNDSLSHNFFGKIIIWWGKRTRSTKIEFVCRPMEENGLFIEEFIVLE